MSLLCLLIGSVVGVTSTVALRAAVVVVPGRAPGGR